MFFKSINITPHFFIRLFILGIGFLLCITASHAQIGSTQNTNISTLNEMRSDMVKADTIDKVLALFTPITTRAQLIQSDYLLLDSPQIAMPGIISVRLMSELPGTELFLLFNSTPSVNEPSFLSAQAIPNLSKLDTSVKIKLSKTSQLTLIVRAGGRWYTVSNEVKIAGK
jgi:sulfur-oxidizing protein SoxY